MNTTIATPLRAEGRLIFKGGSFPIAECVDNETAAAIVGIVNGHDELWKSAARIIDRIATETYATEAGRKDVSRLKAALAAGGNL